MAYNPEKPQFWQPFSLRGEFRTVRRRLSPAAFSFLRAQGLINDAFRDCYREVVYGEYNEDSPVDELLGGDGFGMTRHIFELRDAQPDLEVSTDNNIDAEPKSYRHSFIWRDVREVMVDTWLSVLDAENYPISTVRVFRGLDEVDPAKYGHAGGNTLIVLGAEELLRRRLVKLGLGVSEFACRSKYNMPDFEDGFIAYPRLQRR